MSGNLRAWELLTVAEEQRLRDEYAAWPLNRIGQKRKGVTAALCAKWRISKGLLHRIVTGKAK
jgi:hypothetical protein